MRNDRLTWGILGTGRIAASVLGAIRATSNGTVHAIASRDPERAAAFATQHAVPVTHASYQDLVGDPAIDIVYIPLPVSEHAPWALRAIQSGKAVLVEKPFAMSAAEAQSVFSAAAAAKIMVGEAMMYRFHPLTQRARSLIRDGAVGEARVVRSTFCVDIKDRADIRWNPKTGGGAMRDLGCYCIDVSRHLLGCEPEAGQGVAVEQLGVDASFAASLRFPGAVASFAITLDSTFECSYEVIGSTGRIRVDHGGMVAWPGGEFAITIWDKQGRREEAIPPANHYQLMAEAFAAQVRDGVPYPISAADTLANHRWMDALLASQGAAPAATSARLGSGSAHG